tara:strand:- start:203 stop:514 length:312 start_codon:yes stop_codon:yes gene_type:complete
MDIFLVPDKCLATVLLQVFVLEVYQLQVFVPVIDQLQVFLQVLFLLQVFVPVIDQLQVSEQVVVSLPDHWRYSTHQESLYKFVRQHATHQEFLPMLLGLRSNL